MCCLQFCAPYPSSSNFPALALPGLTDLIGKICVQLKHKATVTLSRDTCIATEAAKPAFISSFQLATARQAWNTANPNFTIKQGDIAVIIDDIVFVCGTARQRNLLQCVTVNVPSTIDVEMTPNDAIAATARFTTAATSDYSSPTSQFAKDCAGFGSTVTVKAPV